MINTIYKVNPREKLFLGFFNEHNARSVTFDGFELIEPDNTVFLAIDGLGMYPLANMSFVVTQAFTKAVGTFGAVLCEVRINDGEYDIVHYSPRFQVTVTRSTEESKEIVEDYNPMDLWFTKMNSLYQEVLQKLNDGEFKGEPGVPGEPGYTPIKGKDYFDGKPGKDGTDGYTPIKGLDYFDGKPGKDGTDYILTQADRQTIAKLAEDNLMPIIDGKAGKDEIPDIMVNGESIVVDGVAEIPISNNETMGLMKPIKYFNLYTDALGQLQTAYSYTPEQLANANNMAFINKGTLNNVLANYIKDTDYGTATKGGTVRGNISAFGIYGNGVPYAIKLNYVDYQNRSDDTFIGKGTLENLWNARHVTLTQAEYDALEVKDPMTEYNIVEE